MNEEMNNNELNSNVEKKNNNGVKTLLMVLIVLVLCLIGLTTYKILVFDKKNDNKQNNNVVDNNDSINEIEENEMIKTSDANEEKEIKNGKKLVVYYDNSEKKYYCKESIVFASADFMNSVVEKTLFICDSNDCECRDIAGDYILVKEDNKYNLYNYKEDKLLVYDFADGYVRDKEEVTDKMGFIDTDSNENPISIMYEKDGFSKIYSFLSNKIYSNVKGKKAILSSYAVLKKFMDNGLLLLTNYDDEDNIHYIFDLKNGKIILETEKVTWASNEIFLVNNDDKSFSTYDFKMNKIYDSKKYDELFMTGENFALVLENTNLNLIDLEGNLLTTFLTDYNKNKYSIITVKSGWSEQNGKEGIYILIAQDGVKVDDLLRDNPDMTEEEAKELLNSRRAGYKYYYIPSSKETGKIASSIGN